MQNVQRILVCFAAALLETSSEPSEGALASLLLAKHPAAFSPRHFAKGAADGRMTRRKLAEGLAALPLVWALAPPAANAEATLTMQQQKDIEMKLSVVETVQRKTPVNEETFGTVQAPGWIAPVVGVSMLSIPAIFIPFVREAESLAPPEENSLYRRFPETLVVKDAGAKGKGLFAAQDIPADTYICEFSGDLLTRDEYMTRYPGKGQSDYTLGVVNDYDVMYFYDGIDPEKGAPARYMNHDGVEPNIRRRTVKREALPPRVLMYAKNFIAAGEELQWDYGPGFWNARPDLVCVQGGDTGYAVATPKTNDPTKQIAEAEAKAEKEKQSKEV